MPGVEPASLLLLQVGAILDCTNCSCSCVMQVLVSFSRLLSDNSVVLLGDIGEGSGALYCLTDLELCCSNEAGYNRGRWDDPNGRSVATDGANFYSSKGFSSVIL